jgi:hypothetical protein
MNFAKKIANQASGHAKTLPKILLLVQDRNI